MSIRNRIPRGHEGGIEMFTEGQVGSDGRAGSPPPDDRRLGPVIARSLELGAGRPDW